MAHINATPWDAALVAKLATEPYASMPRANSDDDAKIAVAINAEETILPPPAPVAVDVLAADVVAILMPTGEFYMISQVLAKKDVSGTLPPSADDMVIIAAWNLMHVLNQYSVIQTSQSKIWASAQTAINALVLASAMSQASADEIAALVMPKPVPTLQKGWEAIGAPTPLNEWDIARAIPEDDEKAAETGQLSSDSVVAAGVI